MKIAIDAHGLTSQATGKATYTLTLLKSLFHLPQAKKHTFTLIAPQKSNFFGNLPANVNWLQIGHQGIKFHVSLLREIRFQNYDVLFSPTSFIPSALSNLPTISVIFDLANFQNLPYQKHTKASIIEHLLINKVLHRSTHLITLAESTKRELIRRLPKIHSKITVIPGSPRLFPTPTPFEKLRQKYALSVPYLLFVGTLEPRKNLINTLTAYNRFLHQLSTTGKPIPQLILVGKKGWHYQSVFTTIRKLNLAPHVRWLSYLPDPDLASLYRNCQFLVYIPFYEGFGLPVIEALSFGKTAITANTSSLPEVIGPCGPTVNPQDINQITQTLYQLYANENKRKKYQVNTKHWLTRFSARENARKLLNILSSTCLP